MYPLKLLYGKKHKRILLDFKAITSVSELEK